MYSSCYIYILLQTNDTITYHDILNFKSQSVDNLYPTIIAELKEKIHDNPHENVFDYFEAVALQYTT